jgi:hypothetical protein
MTSARSLAADSSSDGVVSATVKVNVLDVRISVSERDRSRRHLAIDVDIQNKGDEPLRELNVMLHLTEASCLRLIGPAAHHRGLLGGGRSMSVSWGLEVMQDSDGCGNVIVLAQVSAVDAYGDLITMESDARLLTTGP